MLPEGIAVHHSEFSQSLLVGRIGDVMGSPPHPESIASKRLQRTIRQFICARMHLRLAS